MNELSYSFAHITAKEYQRVKGKSYEEIWNLDDNLKRKMMVARSLDTEKIELKLKRANVNYITLDDPCYPSLLKEIYDPPYILYYRGNKELLKNKMFAIVGSRKASTYTKAALRKIMPHLNDYTIISGLAFGADDIAHKTAIMNNMPTVGVLAFGHSIHYPKVTQSTRNLIEENFITISEFPPESKIEKWKFVSRNRIIAGCAEGTLVTEAELGSGSLITLEMAMDENRHIFCLPGNMTSDLSIGTNLRIQEGAVPVVFPEDIRVTMEETFQI